MKAIYQFIVFTFILNACTNTTEPKINTSEIKDITSYTWTRSQIQRSGISSVYPQKRLIHKTIEVFGKIEVPPQNHITVAVPLGGFLSQSTILPGQKVTKGQALAVLQDAAYIELQRAYLDANSQLNMLQLEFNRQHDLAMQNATSQKTLEQSKAAYESVRVLVKAYYERLQLIGINPLELNAERISSKIILRSPVNGFVTAVNGNTGKYYNAAEVLFELVDPSDIHLTLQINEKDRDAIQLNQNIVAFSNSQPDVEYHGKIVLINNHVSPENTIEAHCHFDVFNKTLIPGLTLNVKIFCRPMEVLTIPQDAVFNDQNAAWVYIHTRDTLFTPKCVSLGQSDNGFVEIKNITERDKIVVKGVNEIRMKAGAE